MTVCEPMLAPAVDDGITKSEDLHKQECFWLRPLAVMSQATTDGVVIAIEHEGAVARLLADINRHAVFVISCCRRNAA